MTPFQQALQSATEGKLQTPTVGTSEGNVDYFGYQLAVHKYNLKLMSKGLKFKGIKLSDLKNYYGLKGRTASDCLPQFIQIEEEYMKLIMSK